MIHVLVVMDDKTFNAVVDTAAQETVISDKLLESFSNKPEVSKEITMHAAGRYMTVRAYKLKPIDIYIGKQCFSQEVYSAPIEDNMLLGTDFLYEHQAKLNIGTSKMQLGNEQISMFMIVDNNKVNTLRIAKVIIRKKARVPAM